MRSLKLLFVFIFCIGLTACEDFSLPFISDYITIEYAQRAPTAFKITEHTHGEILFYPETPADATSKLLYKAELKNITHFPFTYRLGLKALKVKSQVGFITVRIFNHPGNDLKQGDLINDTFTPLSSPTTVDVVDILPPSQSINDNKLFEVPFLQ